MLEALEMKEFYSFRHWSTNWLFQKGWGGGGASYELTWLSLVFRKILLKITLFVLMAKDAYKKWDIFNSTLHGVYLQTQYDDLC